MTEYSLPYYLSNGVEVFVTAGLVLGPYDGLDIESGGTAIDTTDNAPAADATVVTGIEVESGGVEIGTTDNSGSDDDVIGGLASNTIINLSGSQYIESGGTTISAMVNSIGYLGISAGGLAIATHVNDGGVQEVQGGSAQNTIVSSGGIDYIDSGGTSTHGTILSGGVALAYSDVGSDIETSGGVFYASIVESGGTLTEKAADGLVIVEVQSGNEIYITGTFGSDTEYDSQTGNILLGGTASDTVISSGGTIIFDGGTAAGITVQSGGTEIVGGVLEADDIVENITSRTAVGTTVTNGVLEIVEATNTASSTVIKSGGIQVLSGGSSVSATVNSGGSLTVSAGGVAYGTYISSGGHEYVSSGGTDVVVTADGSESTPGGFVVGSGGTQIVSAGGLAVGVNLSNDGVQRVSSGGSAVGTVLSSGGTQAVMSGGLASGTTVLSGAVFRYLGGYVSDLTVSSGGSVIVGGIGASGPVVESGLLADSGSFLYVLSGGTTVGSIVDGGFEGVQSSGYARGAIVQSGGLLRIGSGGTASNVQLLTSAVDLVSGGIDLSTTVSGLQELSAGGTASGAVIYSGGQQVISTGGAALDSVVSSGGTVYVEAGGTGLFISAVDPNARVLVDSGGVTTGTVLSGGQSEGQGPSEQVLAGGTSIATTVGTYAAIDLGGSEDGDLVPGGTSISATVQELGGIEVDSGGILISATVQAGGVVVVFQGGAALDPTISSGGLLHLGNPPSSSGADDSNTGGVVTSARVSAGGTIAVVEGGTALQTMLISSNPSDPTSFAAAKVFDGGVFISTTVGAGAYFAVSAGGTSMNSLIQGEEDVFGGTSLNDNVLSGGTLTATSGAELDYLTISSGGILYGSRGQYSGTGLQISSGGHFYVFSASEVDTIHNDGVIVASGGLVDLSGGVTGSGTVLVDSGANLEIGANSTVADLVVSSGGTVELSGSTVITDPVAVSAGGTIAGFGIITGAFSDEGIVVASGGKLDIDGAVTGPGNFLIDPGATLELDGPVASGVTITFASGGTGALELGDPSAMSGTVAGQEPGDTITDVTPPAICFLQGTRILTPTGEVPVEDLRIGDLVMTRFSAMQPIKWIGRQSFDRRFVRANPNQMPVHIRAGALGEQHPVRDLYVSPGHSMLIGEQLILANLLINGVSITQDEAPEVIHYHHIELATHDCVVADGAWSETFAEGENLRGAFHNVADFEQRYPEHLEATELRLCAPRPLAGPTLEAALRTVLARLPNPVTPGGLRGFVDRASADSGEITGWAQDLGVPLMPVELELLYEGRLLGTVLACAFRDDLAAAQIGRGRCAFVFTAPVALDPNRLHTLVVRRATDGVVLAPTEACAKGLSADPPVAPLPSQEVA